MSARIVIDWGASSFRAYRFGADGAVAETHRASCGILSVDGGRFEDTMRREIGPWLEGGADIFFSGMITSRNGWIETPYVDTPATLPDLAAGALGRDIAGGLSLRFLPGVCQRKPSPDVMRGEEIQVFGVFGPEASGVAVLPGTHSKWVKVEQGRIVSFRSFMTGEVFALMRQHSILGRLIPAGEGAADEAAFLAGVRQAANDASPGLLGDFFSTRSGVLLEAFPAEEIAERLSGMIIGHEIQGAAGLGWASGPVKLIGEPGLCARYAAALEACGVGSSNAPADSAVEGFRRLNALK